MSCSDKARRELTKEFNLRFSNADIVEFYPDEFTGSSYIWKFDTSESYVEMIYDFHTNIVTICTNPF